MEKNSDIKTASDELKQVSGSYEIRRIAELKEKFIRDQAAALDLANERGLKQGLQQGIEQEKIIIAKNLLNFPIDHETISKSTGLTIEQVLKLKEENGD